MAPQSWLLTADEPDWMRITLAQASAELQLLVGVIVVLFGGTVTWMVLFFRRQQSAWRTERELREAGEVLSTASSREVIFQRLISGARVLLPTAVGVRVYLAKEAAGYLTPVASDVDADPRRVTPMRLSQLPDDSINKLRNQQVVQLSNVEEIGSSGQEAKASYLAPMVGRDELRGVLLLLSPKALSVDEMKNLAVLTLKAGAALDGVFITEDLVRRESETRFGALVRHASDLVFVISREQRITFVSPSVERLLGLEPIDIVGTEFSSLLHEDDWGEARGFLDELMNSPSGGPIISIDLRLPRTDGSWRQCETLGANLVDEPSVGGYVLTARDVTERKQIELQLSHQAFHDALTGLPNRALFRNRVEHALEGRRREGRLAAVLFLDCDDFKTVNDSLGHKAGDDLLCEVANRLRRCVRSGDTAARLGGDEFSVLLDGISNELEAVTMAERLLESFAEPVMVEGRDIAPRVSIGIALGDLDYEITAEELLRNADVAMYLAKEEGKGRYQLFEPHMHAAAVERLELKADLQQALAENQFRVVYQPIVELSTGRMSGVEALVRWAHPTRGTVQPDEFIGLAEETGMIIDLGKFVLEQACRQAACFRRQLGSGTPFTVSVNISARQLHRSDIVSDVKEILIRTGADPTMMVLELTETIMLSDCDTAILRLHELRGLGIQLAIDDFGTGYSSFNYLRYLPIDVLKIDKSFVSEVDAVQQVSALTSAVIQLGRVLNLRLVAEGIEKLDQLERLCELGCTFGQGYYLHRPLRPQAVERLVSGAVPLLRA